MTRQWAEQVYAVHPQVQGFLWSSRQDDRALAVLLFGSRVQASDLLDGNFSRHSFLFESVALHNIGERSVEVDPTRAIGDHSDK